jgi:hypothetical protein
VPLVQKKKKKKKMLLIDIYTEIINILLVNGMFVT